ncbi:phage N-6-adenine-methyltransferase [Sodalis sp. TME1]|nr:phage N-6-adenine-methyltransferase [Sodalis sp. TME1]
MALKSNTRPEHKDTWRTPSEVFQALDAEFGFCLDAAADHDNARCRHYLTEEDDALSCDWHTRGTIFCNPPYSNIMPWVKKAAEQCAVQQQTIVMLLPSDTSTAWFAQAQKTADEVRFITEVRLSFISAETGEKGKAGNSKGSVLFIWRPWRTTPKGMTTVSKHALINRMWG